MYIYIIFIQFLDVERIGKKMSEPKTTYSRGFHFISIFSKTNQGKPPSLYNFSDLHQHPTTQQGSRILGLSTVYQKRHIILLIRRSIWT